MKWIALLTAMWLGGCGTVVAFSDAVLIQGYTLEFEAAVAEEYEAMPPSCRPNDTRTPDPCSAVKTMVNDYLWLRDRLRVR